MREFNLTALHNLGNTCYMNSVIQALFATNEFMDYILETKTDKRLHSSLSKLFKDMIDCGESEDSDCISPQPFRDVFVAIKPEFNNHNQHDSQEFLRFLIDGIHEEVNSAKQRKRPTDLPQPKSPEEAWNQYKQYMDDSYLVKLFVGHICSTIKCTECDHKSQCWDTFWDLSLSLPESQDEYYIQSLLEDYFLDEELSDDSMPFCENCKTKRKSIRSLKVQRLPLILTLNMKRFGNDGIKVSKPILVEPDLFLNGTPYHLYACICHQENFRGSGHYNVFCNFYSQNWYYFDDSYIKSAGNFFSEIKEHLKSAYILFYHMKNATIKP